MPSRFRRLAAPAVAVAIVVFAGALTGWSQSQAAGQTKLSFTEVLINDEKASSETVRGVAPDLHHIRSWISAVGASVALADLNNDNTANEACVTDPRDNSVTVIPLESSTASTTTLPPPAPHSVPTAPMGCVPADLDENGSVDLVVYYWGRSPVLYLSTGGDRAEYSPFDLIRPAQIWNSTALNVADVDGDGHLDLLVGNYFPDGARVLDRGATRDTRMQMQDSMSLARNGGTNRLLLTTPAGPSRPPDVVDASNAYPADSANSWTLAWGAQDLTGDTLPELYVANDFGPDQLLVNASTPGKPLFTEVKGERDWTTPKSQVLGYDSFKGMGVTYTHPDQDPLPSIVVSNITSEYALQESNFFFDPIGPGVSLTRGVFPYTQSAERRGLARSGWSWDIKAVDLDNDGSEELYQATGFVSGETTRWPELQELAMANDTLLHTPHAWFAHQPGDDVSGHEPNRLWALTSSGEYVDIAPEAAADSRVAARGVAVGDVDSDGRPDMVVANQWAPSSLLRNTTAGTGQYLHLNLRVPGTNGGTRAAAGTAVTVTASDGSAQYRQLFPANGHAGVSAPELLFGLGQNPGQPVEVRLVWRDAEGQHAATQTLLPGRHTLLLTPRGQVERQ